MKKKHTVCLISPLPPPNGGIGRWTVLIKRYVDHVPGLDVRIIDTSPRWRAIDDLALWKRMVGGSLQLIRDMVFIVWQLIKRPDCIHLNTSGSFAIVRDWAVVQLSRISRIPCFYQLHFGRVPQLAGKGGGWEWRILVWIMKKVHCVVVIDVATERAIKHYLPDVRVKLIPNFIELELLPVNPAGSTPRKTVLFLGWVIPTKGIEELVEAWSIAQPAGWSLQIVGPVADKYQQQLLERHTPDDLEFLGEKTHDEAMALMAEAGVFVLPSHTEGFPNVVMEAMALSTPIIATTVGALPEMLSGGAGYLIPPKEVGALIEALGRVLSEEFLRVSMATAAKKRVLNEYTVSVVFSQLEELWKENRCAL